MEGFLCLSKNPVRKFGSLVAIYYGLRIPPNTATASVTISNLRTSLFCANQQIWSIFFLPPLVPICPCEKLVEFSLDTIQFHGISFTSHGLMVFPMIIVVPSFLYI